MGAASAAEAFNRLKEKVPSAVVTDGPHGAYVRHAGVEAQVPAYPCQPVDLTVPVVSAPEDARSLARYELTRLSERLALATAANNGLDLETRAHYAESKVRIDRTLAANVSIIR